MQPRIWLMSRFNVVQCFGPYVTEIGPLRAIYSLNACGFPEGSAFRGVCATNESLILFKFFGVVANCELPATFL